MRCPSCATENPDNSGVCKECGGDLRPVVPPTDEDRAQQLLQEAFRLSDEGKLALAIAACKRALAANPDSTSAHSLLGILYERAGERELAIRAYEAALRLSPESAADRESLRQLVTSVEAPVAQVAVPATPAAPAPALRRLAPTWYIVAGLGLILVILLLLTARMWRTVEREPPASPEQVRAVPASPAAQAAPQPRFVPAPVSPPLSAPSLAPSVSARVPAVPVGPLGATTPAAAAPARAPSRPRSRAAPPLAPPAPATSPAAVPAEVELFSFPRVAAATPEEARLQYLQGDLAGAIRVYGAFIAAGGGANPVHYQEMGWLYYQAGRRGEAVAAYEESLRRYEQQLQRGQDRDTAQHGIRTARAALRVLELY